jgi:hypothetical protein
VKVKLIDIKNDEQIEMLESKGISGMPAMLATGSKGPIKGPENIMSYLSRKASHRNTQEQEGEGEDATHSFQLEVLEEGDEEENKDQDAAKINARVAAEAARRGIGGAQSKKPKTADEAIEENRRRKAARNKPKQKKVQFKAEADDDDDDEQPGKRDAQLKADDKRAKRRDEKEYNIGLTPAEISRSIPATSGEDKRDQDLADKFWAGRFTSTNI